MTQQRHHKLTADFGMKDYYNFYDNKYNAKVSRKIYNQIISDFNKAVVNMILEEGDEYKVPYTHFTLQIRKDKRKPRLNNKGELMNPVPVDWKRTKALWERDEEAKEKKLLVRYNNSHTSGYVFRLFLQTWRSSLKYKRLIKVRTNREFQRKLSKRIKNLDEPFDAYLLYK